MPVFYKRNTNVYISKAPNGSANATNTVQITVKDFSYNQASRTAEIGRETLDPTQERTLDPHIAVISPVNFTFTTYVLSTVDTNVTSPEEYLWTSLMGADTIADSPNSTPTQSTIDFADGNVATLQELTLWFDQPTQSEGNYRLDNAIVDSAIINFNINGIAEIQWSGRALGMVEDNVPPDSTDRTGLINYIKNKFSTCTVNALAFVLTGGSVTISNNTRFYGRSKLGEVTKPLGHYTGNRKISGVISAYLKSGTNDTVDLLNSILTTIENTDYETTTALAIIINVGGLTNTPRLTINLPKTIVDIPRLNFNEVVTIDISFTSKEESGNYTSITYVN